MDEGELREKVAAYRQKLWARFKETGHDQDIAEHTRVFGPPEWIDAAPRVSGVAGEVRRVWPHPEWVEHKRRTEESPFDRAGRR